MEANLRVDLVLYGSLGKLCGVYSVATAKANSKQWKRSDLFIKTLYLDRNDEILSRLTTMSGEHLFYKYT